MLQVVLYTTVFLEVQVPGETWIHKWASHTNNIFCRTVSPFSDTKNTLSRTSSKMSQLHPSLQLPHNNSILLKFPRLSTHLPDHPSTIVADNVPLPHPTRYNMLASFPTDSILRGRSCEGSVDMEGEWDHVVDFSDYTHLHLFLAVVWRNSTTERIPLPPLLQRLTSLQPYFPWQRLHSQPRAPTGKGS